MGMMKALSIHFQECPDGRVNTVRTDTCVEVRCSQCKQVIITRPLVDHERRCTTCHKPLAARFVCTNKECPQSDSYVYRPKPRFIQLENPIRKRWVKVDRWTGRIVAAKKSAGPYKRIAKYDEVEVK